MATVKSKRTTSNFDLSKYQTNDRLETKIVEIGDDSFEVTLRPLSWFRRNQLVSKCMKIDANGSNFDGALYVREVLKEIIVSAPWGKTTDGFLLSINTELGEALETLVNANEDENEDEDEPEEIKKDSIDT